MTAMQYDCPTLSDSPASRDPENAGAGCERPSPRRSTENKKINTFIDLFCGVGGFHVAATSVGLKCLFASDIDEIARQTYHTNLGLMPHGDITCIQAKDIPKHDLLCAGFPCQPFSIIGKRKGFADSRGTLFFEIVRVLTEQRPRALILENVKQLATANSGKTLKQILSMLEGLGYTVDFRVLNALDFGLPQKRERVLIVGRFGGSLGKFSWPSGTMPMQPLSALLEPSPDKRHFVSQHILEARRKAHQPSASPSIWHENKGGNVSSHPFSCALRAGASHNYLLVDGKRRLTPREMFRLQGFPDHFKLAAKDHQHRRQAGNAVPVPMVRAVIESLINA
ncbi:MAG: DNA cytosine methyltransferase [Candidatus Eutrophobiaceae bacterium]